MDVSDAHVPENTSTTASMSYVPVTSKVISAIVGTKENQVSSLASPVNPLHWMAGSDSVAPILSAMMGVQTTPTGSSTALRQSSLVASTCEHPSADRMIVYGPTEP